MAFPLLAIPVVLEIVKQLKTWPKSGPGYAGNIGAASSLGIWPMAIPKTVLFAMKATTFAGLAAAIRSASRFRAIRWSSPIHLASTGEPPPPVGRGAAPSGFRAATIRSAPSSRRSHRSPTGSTNSSSSGIWHAMIEPSPSGRVNECMRVACHRNRRKRFRPHCSLVIAIREDET